MSIQRPRLIYSFAVFLLVFLAAEKSFAALMVAPERIVLEPKSPVATLSLSNTDSKPHSFKITWKMMTMDESGRYHDIPETRQIQSDPHAVQNMVVFNPSQINIKAHGKLDMHFSLRLPAGLPPGEYRAHLVFNAAPDEESGQANGKGMSFGLHFLINTSIPVIVRTGGTTGDIKIINQSLYHVPDNKSEGLHLELTHQQGSNSVYGRIVIYQDKDRIGILNNVALYPEQGKRILTIPLSSLPRHGSSLRIVYEGAGEYSGKTLAEENFTVPN